MLSGTHLMPVPCLCLVRTLYHLPKFKLDCLRVPRVQGYVSRRTQAWRLVKRTPVYAHIGCTCIPCPGRNGGSNKMQCTHGRAFCHSAMTAAGQEATKASYTLSESLQQLAKPLQHRPLTERYACSALQGVHSRLTLCSGLTFIVAHSCFRVLR